jgi:hypothetical protein
MIETVSKILEKCNTNERNISPTLLYNEGWMIRLLVSASVDFNIRLEHIDFGKIKHWYSEGLLSSPFSPEARSDKRAEGFTHADMALGDFSIKAEDRGDISVDSSDGVFGVIEAKMGSKLSLGTKNAPNYNQASRNLACIAFNTLETKHDIFFSVVAPKAKIEEHGIRDIVNIPFMLKQITDRFDSYDKSSKAYSYRDQVLARAKQCKCMVISYESWIEEFTDTDVRTKLEKFLEFCYEYNRIKAP